MSAAFAETMTVTAMQDVIERARERARVAGSAVIVSWTAPLDGFADPVAYFAAADLAAPRTFWLEPDRGFALAGTGSVLSVPASADDAYGEAASALRAAQRAAISGAEPGCDPVGPVALGGFAFDPTRETGLEWAGFPAAMMTVPTAMLWIENGRAAVVVNAFIDGESDTSAVAERLSRNLDRARGAATSDLNGSVPAPMTVLEREIPQAGPWKSMVAEVADEVRAGKFDKVVLARSEWFACENEIDVPATLRRMAETNRPAMIFAIGVPGAVFLGASPETLVRLEDGRLQTTPLAGSIARGTTPEEDARLARRLLRSQKDRIEHDVVVGAILQALDPFCLYLAPEPDAPVIVANRTVQHLATPITGRVRPGVSAVDIAGRLHPTPAVGGYPADAALAAIRAREGFDRGWYAGPVGWCGPGGDGPFCIGIRSALVRGNEATLYAGCGIVADSDPETEYAETCLKLRAIGTALGV
ncbi:MAG: isochorismate synthase, partial [Thermomicrobiales bacterium]